MHWRAPRRRADLFLVEVVSVMTRRPPVRCGKDVFVHVHDVEAAGMKMLVADQLVVYELGPARDGRLKAVNLRLL